MINLIVILLFFVFSFELASLLVTRTSVYRKIIIYINTKRWIKNYLPNDGWKYKVGFMTCSKSSIFIEASMCVSPRHLANFSIFYRVRVKNNNIVIYPDNKHFIENDIMCVFGKSFIIKINEIDPNYDLNIILRNERDNKIKKLLK